MRHGNKVKKIGRTASHRKATLANMAASLIEHKHIKTTLAKAKALRMYVEPIITKAKDDTTHSRRLVFALLQQKTVVHELFTQIGPKIMERPGGYTRILKLGLRQGDSAEMALIELVDYNDFLPSTLGAKKTTRRSRRGTGKKNEAETTIAETVVAEPKAKAKKEPKAEVAPVVAEEVVEVTETPVAETLVAEAPVADAPEPTSEEPKAE